MLKTLIETPELPISTMKKVCDIEYYDGPLVSYYKTGTEHYIWYWCDCDKETHRWMVFRVSEYTANYLKNKYGTLKDLIPACILDSHVYFVDHYFTKDHVTRVLVKHIPEDYLPG